MQDTGVLEACQYKNARNVIDRLQGFLTIVTQGKATSPA